ncbi:DUF6124 family protein [Pseudomonas sp. McL0111]|uniref:DUF6124 family protein n=1 Tax=Pseudomonas sp. McL0111 TaxID=3457357 RepID=UPI00403EC086
MVVMRGAPLRAPVSYCSRSTNPRMAARAINFYLNPKTLRGSMYPQKPNRIFLIDPSVDDETLLVEACESLASVTVTLGDFAGLLEGPNRKTLLGIAQVVMLGELAVNQALDNVEPKE